MKPKNVDVSLFLRFMVSYLLILIIPILIGSLVYVQVVKMVEEDAVKSNLAMLEQSRKTMERQLKDIDATILNISNNMDVRRLLNEQKPVEGALPTKISDTWAEIHNYHIDNDLVKNFYIFFDNIDIMMTNQTIYINLENFYDAFFTYADMDYAKWEESILNQYYYRQIFPTTKIKIDSGSDAYLPYFQSIPLDIPQSKSGFVMALINENELHNLFESLYTDNNGLVYIMDSTGKIITMKNETGRNVNSIPLQFKGTSGFSEVSVTGEKMTVTYTVSPYNGWTYVAAIPSSVVVEKVQYIKKITFMVMIAIFILSFLASLYLAYRNSKPIKALIRTIRDGFENRNIAGKNVFDFLQHSIKYLMDNNFILQQAIEEHRPYLRYAFFYRLLKGEFYNENEIEIFRQYIGLDLKGNNYIVAIIQLLGGYGTGPKDPLHARNARKITIKETLINSLDGICYAGDLDEDKIALLIEMDCDFEEDYDHIVKLIESNIKDLEELQKIRAIAGMGNVYGSLISVSRSYNEAKQALDFCEFGNEEVMVCYRDIPRKNAIYFYPIDMEQRLINLVKAGEKGEAEKQLADIYDENFKKRKIDVNMAKKLISELTGTVLKIAEQIRIEDPEVNEMIAVLSKNQNSNMYKSYEYICTTLFSVCDMVNLYKRSHNIDLKDRIVQYVHESYKDTELCLTKIAGVFGLTETYLSKFFKEQTGENLSVYLERIRMEHAMKLLDKSDLNIDDISKQVGYVTTHVFSRAFKRSIGVAPSAYKKCAKDY